jgi:hypothetical protein
MRSIVGLLGFFSTETSPLLAIQYLAAGESDCVVEYSIGAGDAGLDHGIVQLERTTSDESMMRVDRIDEEKINKNLAREHSWV